MISVRSRRLLYWVALPVLALILLYAAVGFWLVPRLIRSNAQSFVSEHYHRQLALGAVRFNPFSLRLDIRDCTLPDSDGQPMLSFKHLLLDLTVASVWHLGPDFQTILLEQPYVRVVIKRDGSLNFSELALPPSPQAKPKAGPARLLINQLSVQGGNVAFQDHAHPSEFRTEITPITFELHDFSTLGQGGGTYALTGRSEAGERFSWSGSLTAQPLASHGTFAIAALKAQTVSNYIRDSVQFELPSGAISINGEYDFTAATTPVGLSVRVQDVEITDLGVRPKKANEDYIKLTKLDIRETNVDVGKRMVRVGGVHLSGGELRSWYQTPDGLNLLQLIGSSNPSPSPTTTTPDNSAKPAAEAAPAPPPASAPPPPSATPAASAPPPPSAPPPASAPAAAPSTPWTVSIPDIALEGVKISAEDRQVTPTVAMQFEDLSLHVTGYGSAKTQPVAVTLTSRVNRAAKLNLKADLSADLQGVKGHAELANFDLTALQPYIAQRTAMTLLSGLLSTQLNLERQADGDLAVTGQAQAMKVRSVDNLLKKDFIKFEHLQAEGIEYHSKPASVRIRSVVARGPYARVILEADRTVNVSRVLKLKSAAQPASGDNSKSTQTAAAEAAPNDTAPAVAAADSTTPTVNIGSPPPSGSESAAASSASNAPAAEKPPSGRRGRHQHQGSKTPPPPPPASEGGMGIAIDTIRLEAGSANYADFWIQPNFSVGIQALEGSIVGLSSDPRSRAKVDLQGKVDRYAPVRIWGETNPLATTGYTDIKMSFKGVELTSATPYSGRFAGYKIEKGKLSVDIGYKIQDRRLTAEHHLVIDQLELGERVESPDAVHLPLKLAIALLKDRNGVIDLNLPVTGSLDDPQFSLAPLLWKAVVNLFKKVATAPFALLGHLFGGGEQMNYIEFAPGSASLDQPAQDKLAALTKALKEKDKLQLDIPVTYSADVDGPGLAAKHLNDQLGTLQETAAHAQKKQPPQDATQADPAQRYHSLLALYRAQQKDAPLPDSVQAIESAAHGKGPPPDLTAANHDLETALLQKISVSDNELEALGKHRAQAIQDVLLGTDGIDPSRVFVIGSESKQAADKEKDKDKVRVELALK